jgi:F-type H+-transporting ATPase subunit beta
VTRGEIVSDLQQPLQVPVGDRLLGRMLNLFGFFFGEAIDRKKPIAGGEWRSIHAEPALDRYQEMAATGVLKNAVLVFGQMNEPVYGFDR